MKEITVAIPTHAYKGRERNLGLLIESLCAERNIPYIKEILIVDNGCTLLPADWENGFFPIRVVQEARLGLNNARNCAVKAADSSIIAFVDDDVFVSRDWAESIFAGYENGTLCVGGAVSFRDGEGKSMPGWLTDYFSRFLFPPKFPEESGVLRTPYYLIGANMSFRKEAFERFGLFDAGLDRKGNNLLSNGDTDFIIRLPGDSVRYAHGAQAFGIIKTERFTRVFMVRRLFWQGISDAIMVKRRGAENFYDRNEVLIGKEFFQNLLSKLAAGKFFEAFCFVVRWTGFVAGSLQA